LVIAKKRDIIEQADNHCTSAKKRKMGKEWTYSKPKNVFFFLYQQTEHQAYL
jgi:hypothetical protein